MNACLCRPARAVPPVASLGPRALAVLRSRSTRSQRTRAATTAADYRERQITRAARVSLSSSGLTKMIFPLPTALRPRTETLALCPSRTEGRSAELTVISIHTRLRSTMTKSSVSRLSRPTAVPSSTLRSTSPGDRRTDVLQPQGAFRRLRDARDLIVLDAERKQLLPSKFEPHRCLRSSVARLDVLLFGHGPLPQRRYGAANVAGAICRPTRPPTASKANT